MFNVGDGGRFVGVRAVAGDRGAVIAEIDVGFVAGYALAGDAGALQAADEFLGFAGEHGAYDGFDSAWDGVGHYAEAFVRVSGYPKRGARWISGTQFFLWGEIVVFAGGFAGNSVLSVVFWW